MLCLPFILKKINYAMAKILNFISIFTRGPSLSFSFIKGGYRHIEALILGTISLIGSHAGVENVEKNNVGLRSTVRPTYIVIFKLLRGHF